MTSPTSFAAPQPLKPAVFPPITRMEVSVRMDTAEETKLGPLVLAGFSDVIFIRPTEQLAAENNSDSFRSALRSITLTRPNLAIDLSEQQGLQFDHIAPVVTDLINASRAALFVVTEDPNIAVSLRRAFGAQKLTVAQKWQEVIRALDAKNIERGLDNV